MKTKTIFSVLSIMGYFLTAFPANAFDECSLRYKDPQGKKIEVQIPLQKEGDFKLMSFDLEKNFRFIFNAHCTSVPRSERCVLPPEKDAYVLILYQGEEIVTSVKFSRTTDNFYMQFGMSGEILCGSLY